MKKKIGLSLSFSYISHYYMCHSFPQICKIAQIVSRKSKELNKCDENCDGIPLEWLKLIKNNNKNTKKPDHTKCWQVYKEQNSHADGSTTLENTCTTMFISALFIIARIWKQPRCPSADEWIRKLWYIYTMEYYSAIKMNRMNQF